MGIASILHCNTSIAGLTRLCVVLYHGTALFKPESRAALEKIATIPYHPSQQAAQHLQPSFPYKHSNKPSRDTPQVKRKVASRQNATSFTHSPRQGQQSCIFRDPNNVTAETRPEYIIVVVLIRPKSNAVTHSAIAYQPSIFLSGLVEDMKMPKSTTLTSTRQDHSRSSR